jgi:serine/threonine protein kinase
VFSAYPAEIHDSLLSLLERFSIVLRITSKEENRDEVLVPSLLPDSCRGNVLAQVWSNELKPNFEEFGRYYQFPFLPLGFFARLIVRVLHLPRVKGLLYWRSGMVLDYLGGPPPKSESGGLKSSASDISIFSGLEHKQRAFLEYDPVQFTFSIRIRVPKTTLHVGRSLLLQILIDSVETVLEEYCMRESAQRLIPCTHCISDPNCTSVFMFSFLESVRAVTEKEGYVFCNHIRSQSRMVPVDKLAPDIALSGIPLIHEKQLILGDLLGKGGFGAVYKAQFFTQLSSNSKKSLPRQKIAATLKESTGIRTSRANRGPTKFQTCKPQTVAVKELICSDKMELGIMFADFQQEVYLMNQIKRSPNIVRLHGVCLFPRPQMVLEYLAHGDLHAFLHPIHKDKPENLQTYIKPEKFPWALRLLVALDVAKGMLVLHSQNPSIIHRDLRSPNIFLASLQVDSTTHAKVADFGLARVVAPTISGALNTWQWLAPEVLGISDDKSTITKPYGIASDVYSFSICCWEIATGGFPFDEFNEHPDYAQLGALSLTAIKTSIVKENLRPTLLPCPAPGKPPVEGETCPEPFKKLIQDCWHRDPEKRPSFLEIVRRLSSMQSLNAKQQSMVDQLLSTYSTGPTPPPKFIARDSCRVSINFQAMELRSLIKQKSTAALFGVEFLNQGKALLLSDQEMAKVSVKCACFVEEAELWFGCSDGTILIMNSKTLQIQKQLKPYDNSVDILFATNLNTVWSSTKTGISIWSATVSELRFL